MFKTDEELSRACDNHGSFSNNIKHEYVNLGTVDKPKLVKLSKTSSPKVKAQYVRLLFEFSHVFTWDYSDLKVYDSDITQHTIPIKPD